jgi:hypothetical protein
MYVQYGDVKYDIICLLTSRIPLEAMLGTDRNGVRDGICW